MWAIDHLFDTFGLYLLLTLIIFSVALVHVRNVLRYELCVLYLMRNWLRLSEDECFLLEADSVPFRGQ